MHNVAVGKPQGKRPLVRPMHRWKDNTKMYLKKMGWEGRHWIHMGKWQAL